MTDHCISRRAWIEGVGALGVSTVAAKLLGCTDKQTSALTEFDGSTQDGGVNTYAGPFTHGVASGDPLPDAIILWTRVSPDPGTAPANIAVHWEIATDSAFEDIMQSGDTTTEMSRDYTLKIDVRNLAPATTYYYRFQSLGETSPVGRTKTAPQGEVARVRFGIASCGSFAQGYFHGYRFLSERTDIEAIIHLGDYIYEYASGEFGSLRPHEPSHEAITLEDYRLRYAQYRRDPNLQELHRQQPFIVIWDDHEFANNAWPGGADNHMPDTEGSWDARKDAAMQAHREWMPYREQPSGRLYRTLQFGNLLDLMMLDTRMMGRDAQVLRIDDAATDQPARQLLGSEQEMWLFDRLRESEARWKVVAQQVMLGQARGLANPDQWDGYPAARQRFLSFLKTENIGNVAVLTGDIHSSWANDLVEDPTQIDDYDPETGRGSLAVEFVTPGVTSPTGLSGDLARSLEEQFIMQPHTKYVDLEKRGYMVLDVTPDRVRSSWFHLESVETLATTQTLAVSFSVENGTKHLMRDEIAIG